MEYPLPPQLSTMLNETQSRSERVVVMTCGITGSGKSTLAKTIVKKYSNFVRLSIDTYVYTHYGAYGIDFPASDYSSLQDKAVIALEKEFRALLKEGKRDVVLDFSFYSREYRDEWRRVISGVLGEKEKEVKKVIVYFDAEEELLWRRIQERKRGVKDADSAAEISRELLQSYVAGFERPGVDEGKVITVKVE